MGLMASQSIYSLSHGKFLQKINETTKDPQTNQEYTIISRYPVSFQDQKYITKTNYVINGKIYYPNDWDYFKAYIPAGATVSIQIVTYPNTTLRLHAKFKGDKNNTFDHVNPVFTGFTNDFQNKLLSNQEYTVDATIMNNTNLRFNNLSDGGWLYFSLVGDTSGYYENPPGYVRVDLIYTIEIADKQKFYNHLQSLRYNAPYGDPIDAVDYLVVKNPAGPEDIIKYNISLDRPMQTYEYSEDTYFSDTSSETSSSENIHSSSISSKESSCTDPIRKKMGLCQENSFSDNLEPIQSSSSNSSSSIANSGSSISNEEKQLAELLDGKSKSIKGYYIHYGEGKFQWIYITAGNKTPYKLEGWDEENKRIIWKNLSSCLEANVEGKSITFHKKSSCENSEEAQSSSINQSESSSSQSSLQSSSEASTYTEESYSNQSSSVSSTQGFQGEQGTLPVPRNN